MLKEVSEELRLKRRSLKLIGVSWSYPSTSGYLLLPCSGCTCWWWSSCGTCPKQPPSPAGSPPPPPGRSTGKPCCTSAAHGRRRCMLAQSLRKETLKESLLRYWFPLPGLIYCGNIYPTSGPGLLLFRISYYHGVIYSDGIIFS